MYKTGDLLKNERLKKKLTLEDVEKITKIRKKNLEAVERGDWQGFPSKTYIIGIIHTYGRFLHLDEEKLAAFFRREYERTEDVRFRGELKKSSLTPETKRVFKIIVLLIFFFFTVYFAYQLKLYFSPPKLEIVSPKVNVFFNKDKISLVGITEKEAIVMVNGERVYLDKSNIFETTIPLTQKINEVTIEVTGTNGRKTVVKKIFEKKI